MAHYGLYTYISPLVSHVGFTGGIQLASVIFGIGTILSVLIAAKFVDDHLGPLTVFILALAFITMIMLILFKGMFIVSHIAFLFWGISFGALVTIFQAAITSQVETGKDVATSLQSSTFNFGIVFGSLLGGVVLDRFSVFHIVYITLALLIIPILFSIFAKETFYKNSDSI